MERKKLTAFVVLVAFLFTVILPAGAVWAEDPVPSAVPNVTVKLWGTENEPLTTTAGALQLVTVEVGPYAAEKPFDLKLTFPKDLQPQGGSGQTYTIKEVDSNGRNYSVYVKTPTTTGDYTGTITWKIGSQPGSAQANFTVTPEAVDWTNAKSRENSILDVRKKTYTNEEAAAGAPLRGTINLQLRDLYNNETGLLKKDHSLYIWLEDSQNNKRGEIVTDADEDGGSAVTNCKIKQIGSSRFYEITEVKGSQLTFSYTIAAPGGEYTVYVADGNKNVANTDALEALTSKKEADVNMILTQVDVEDYGDVTTKPDKNAQIRVTLTNPPGKEVYLRLPEGFVTDQEEKTVTDAKGKTIRLVPLVAGANDLLIKEVPKAGTETYQSAETMQLYLGEQPYQPVKFTGSITVHAAKIQSKIKNFLDFRHGTDKTTVAPEVQFVFTDLSTQSDQYILIDFSEKTESGEASPIKPSQYEEVTTGSMTYWRVKSRVTMKDGKAQVNVPVQKNPEAGAFMHDGYDKTMTIGLTTKSSTGKEVEKDQIKLRYRITDSVVDPANPQTKVAAPVGQKEIVLDGVMHYETATTLYLNSEILNGRNLYIWVTDANGKPLNTNDPKDRFNITTSSPVLQLNNTFLGSVEGSSSGSNNIYTITNKGETTSEELNTTEIPLTLTSAKAGTFRLKVAVGSSAQDVYTDANAQLMTEPFVLVDKNQIPSVKVENVGKIYAKTSSDTADTAYGQVKFTIKNFKLEDQQQGQLTISLDPQNTTTSSQYLLTVDFNDNQKKGGYYEVIADVQAESLKSFTEAKLLVPVTSGVMKVGDVGASADKMAALSRVEWSGEVEIEKRAEVSVALQAGDGWQDGKLVADQTGKVTVTVKPGENLDAAVLKNKAVLLWLDDGAVVQGEYLQGDGLTRIAEGDNAGKYLLSVTAGKDNKFSKEFAVQGLAVGKYTLMAQVVQGDKNEPVPNCASAGLPLEVTPKAADLWNLAVAVNGKSLSADNTGLFTAETLPINEAITVKATITKGTTPMADVKVKLNGEAAQGATVNAQELTTDANGAVTFKITPKADTDYEYLYRLTAVAEEKEQVSGTVKLPVNSKAEPTPPDSDSDKEGDTLEIIGMTSKVAVDDRASVFLEVYDDDDDLIKITSDSMARKMIERVYFDDLPGNSDLKNSDINIQRVEDGIEVSFRPDYRGDYDLVIVGQNDTVRPDITAVRQGEVVRMDLEYTESTLGLGKTSSVPVIYTYDKDDVKAERSLLATNRLEFYATGGAVDGTDDFGRVSVKTADRYVGTTIKAVVTDTRLDLVAEYVFDVEDRSWSSSDHDNSNISGTQSMQVVLWDNYGAVGSQNRFSFYLVGENGFRAEVENGQMSSSAGASATVSVASKPSNASVSASIYNNGRSLEGGGDGLLYVSCSKEGTVKLNITVKVYNPDKSTNYYKRYDYYRGTVSLQFKEDAPVNWGNNGSSNSSWGSSSNSNTSQSSSVSVAMFVGSTRYTVNMNSKTMEAAPFLSDGRIYLPLRVLSDAIGAGITYDDKTQKITIIYDSERVILQIDSDTVTTTREGTYRVDGAPVIVDGRTFVPLRVVGEALRLRVTTVTDVNNKVVGAVLSK